MYNFYLQRSTGGARAYIEGKGGSDKVSRYVVTFREMMSWSENESSEYIFYLTSSKDMSSVFIM